MIQITPHMKIFLAYESPDFRNGLEGLSGICREHLKLDPLSWALFLFRNKRGTSIRMLVYDGQGLWCMTKRLSQGQFKWWPKRGADAPLHVPLAAHELQVLLWNGNPQSASVADLWRPVRTAS